MADLPPLPPGFTLDQPQQADPNDFTNRYNTQLTPQEEKRFQAFAKSLGQRGSTYDYDLRGAFKAGAGQAANGHFPDTFKKPNHPTFSKDSKYSGVDGFQGGAWAKQPDGSWSFTPTQSMLQFHSPEELQNYFQRVEAGNKLVLPQQQQSQGQLPPLPPGFTLDAPGGAPAASAKQPPKKSYWDQVRETLGLEKQVMNAMHPIAFPLGETALHLASGTIAAPASGIAGIAGAPFGADTAARNTEAVGNALTYQPSSAAGQFLTKVATAPMALVAKGGDVAGDVVARASGSPAAGAATNTVVQALPMLLLRGRGKAGEVAGDVSRTPPVGRSPAPRSGEPQAPAPAPAERPAGLAQVSEKAPTKEQLKTQSRAAYKRAEDAGAVISADSFQKAQQSIGSMLEKEGIDPTLHPSTTAALKRIAETEGPVTLEKLETLRRIAKDAESTVNAADRRLATKVVDTIDRYADTLSQKDLNTGSPEAIAALKEARNLYSRARKADTLDELVERAETRAGANFTQAGMEHALRQEFKTLALNSRRMRLFTAEERAAIKKVAAGGPLENTLRNLGKFDPTSGGMASLVSLGTGGIAAASGAGAAGALVPIVGFAAKRAATRMTMKNVARANELVRRGPPPKNALAKPAPRNALAKEAQ